MENKPRETRSLDERLAADPKIREQMMRMADELLQQAEQSVTMDEAEEKLVPMVRQLGRELLSECAGEMAIQAPIPSGKKVRRQVKKKRAG